MTPRCISVNSASCRRLILLGTLFLSLGNKVPSTQRVEMDDGSVVLPSDGGA